MIPTCTVPNTQACTLQRTKLANANGSTAKQKVPFQMCPSSRALSTYSCTTRGVGPLPDPERGRKALHTKECGQKPEHSTQVTSVLAWPPSPMAMAHAHARLHNHMCTRVGTGCIVLVCASSSHTSPHTAVHSCIFDGAVQTESTINAIPDLCKAVSQTRNIYITANGRSQALVSGSGSALRESDMVMGTNT